MADLAAGTDTKPLRSDDVIFFPAGDELCLHNVGTAEYYLLNEIGEQVWNLCDGSSSVAEIVARIVADYDAEDEQVAADVLEFIQYLDSEDCLM